MLPRVKYTVTVGIHEGAHSLHQATESRADLSAELSRAIVSAAFRRQHSYDEFQRLIANRRH